MREVLNVELPGVDGSQEERVMNGWVGEETDVYVRLASEPPAREPAEVAGAPGREPLLLT